MRNIDLALVICEQKQDREKVAAALLKCGLCSICCSNLREARLLLPQDDFRVVLCKDTLSDGDFRAVLREIRNANSVAPVIVLSRSNDCNSYLSALAAGAFDYIVCPPNPAQTETIICSALSSTADPGKVSRAAA